MRTSRSLGILALEAHVAGAETGEHLGLGLHRARHRDVLHVVAHVAVEGVDVPGDQGIDARLVHVDHFLFFSGEGASSCKRILC